MKTNNIFEGKERFGQYFCKKYNPIKKGLIRILCCLTLCCFANFTYGQNLDSLNLVLDQYFKMILVNNYSINPVSIDKELPNTKINLEGHYLSLQLSTNDRLLFPEIIKKTNEYSSLSKNIRVNTAAYYIYIEFIKTNYINKELKKKLVSKILQLSGSILHDPYEGIKLLDSSYFNLEARNRIREILNDRLSPEEIFLKKQLKKPNWKVEDSIKDKGLVRSFKKYSVHGSLKFNEWIDSLNMAIINDYFTDYSLIRNGIINLIGNSLLYEFAPKLEELYANPKYAHRKEQIKLVLARFQYKDYETKALEEINAEIHKGNWERSVYLTEWENELLYISTQKSLFILIF